MALPVAQTRRGPIPKFGSQGQNFPEFIEDITPGYSRLDMCIQCGTCGGSCPSAADMDHTPREIFALLRADQPEEVLKSNTPWYCVSCYLCTSRCPQEVHITDLMYTLKSLAIQVGHAQVNQAVDFSNTFIAYIENNGRSFELGLATRHNLRHHPLDFAGMASMGWGMLSKGRLHMTPEKIKGMDQLSKILDRAKQLEVVL